MCRVSLGCWLWFPLSLMLSVASLVEAQSNGYELLLRRGLVFDGAGGEAVVADVAVSDGKIVAMGELHESAAALVIDCTSLVVCPGFIDLHTHSDNPILAPETRANTNYLLQGCTTIVTGNCGSGPTDLASYFQKIDQFGAGTHVIHLLPQGSLRNHVMGQARREPTEDEHRRMLELAEQAMLDGAYGMSTGLIYVPSMFADTQELIEIAKVVAKYGGIYASHIRGEGIGLIDSIQEVLEIADQSGAHVHVSHFKASGKDAWGSLHLAVKMIEEARSAGVAITADQYPYAASSTSLEATLFPAWSREGGRKQLEKRLSEPETAARIRAAVVSKLNNTNRIQIAVCQAHREWIGMSLDEIAAAEGMEAADIALQIQRSGGASVVNFGMNEDDVRLAMGIEWVATASDGGAKIPSGSLPHPRSFGTFPRKIGHYAIQEKTLSLAQAIRSASALPAEILGLTDRGMIQEGLAADLVVFDPETFRDRATFTEPYLPPTGIRFVFVEGVAAVFEGQATGALAGRVLRKPARSPHEATTGKPE